MKVFGLLASSLLVLFLNSASNEQVNDSTEDTPITYKVNRLKKPLVIDADWTKPQWRSVKALEIRNFIREKPEFRPDVKAKMMYDADNLYVIFCVEDKYVRSITTQVNGPVWKDSAVEFFFSPNISSPSSYFNLEVNCGGTPLLGYNSTPKVRPSLDDIKKIEIAHSLPGTVDPEISGAVKWFVEYRIPLAILKNYTEITSPAKGVRWRGNFYKIAENNSNPHHASWSPINHPKPTFHLPQYFGVLEFE